MANILIFTFIFKLGFLPHAALQMYELTYRENPDFSYYTEMEMDFEFQAPHKWIPHFFFAGAVDIDILPNPNSLTFNPTGIGSTFSCGFRMGEMKPFLLEFRYTHYCKHPIHAWLGEALTSIVPIYETSHDELLLTFIYSNKEK